MIARLHPGYTEARVQPSRLRWVRCALGAAADRALRAWRERFRRASPTAYGSGIDGMTRSDPGVRVTSGLREFIVYTNQPQDEARSATATHGRTAAARRSGAKHRGSTTPQSGRRSSPARTAQRPPVAPPDVALTAQRNRSAAAPPHPPPEATTTELGSQPCNIGHSGLAASPPAVAGACPGPENQWRH
jgi:hypothetical protein